MTKYTNKQIDDRISELHKARDELMALRREHELIQKVARNKMRLIEADLHYMMDVNTGAAI